MDEKVHYITTHEKLPNVDGLLPGLGQANRDYLSKKIQQEITLATAQLVVAGVAGAWMIVIIVKEFRNN